MPARGSRECGRMRRCTPSLREYLAAHIDFSSGGSRLARRGATAGAAAWRARIGALPLPSSPWRRPGGRSSLATTGGPPIAEAYAELGGIPLRLLLVAGLNRAVLFGTRLALGMFAVAVAVAFVASVT